ncbi:MAG TPA: hypothetical protein VN618_10420 [Solirubrobacteraceae bacterium]|nr:hypothetical protein [Solirubrobacteraceae bacterium]
MSGEPPIPPADGPPTEPTRPLRPAEPVPPPVRPHAPRMPVAHAVPEHVVEHVPPVYPPEERRGDNPWPAVVVGILALLIGGALGYAIGHKNENGSRRAETAPAVTRTVTQPKVIERSHTVTATAPANAANEERRVEAESQLRKSEKENEELKQQLEGGEHP